MVMDANLRISDFRRPEPENPARTALEQIDDKTRAQCQPLPSS
jgi:hypothetical protein